MGNINFKIRLKDFFILDFNYKFDENIFSDLMNDVDVESFSANVKERSKVKIAIHNSYKEMFIIMDTNIQEIIDLKDLSINERFKGKEFILKSLDISVKFNFSLELDNPNISLEGFSEDDEFMNIFQENLKQTALEACRYNIVNIIKQISSIDYNQCINLKFPQINISEIKIKD